MDTYRLPKVVFHYKRKCYSGLQQMTEIRTGLGLFLEGQKRRRKTVGSVTTSAITLIYKKNNKDCISI